MKPFLCIEKVSKGEKYIINGAEFQTASVKDELYKGYKQAMQENAALKKKAELPNSLRIVQVFFLLISAVSLFQAFMGVFNKEETADVSYIDMLFVVLFCAVICSAIQFYGKMRKKKVLESNETKSNNAKINRIVSEMEKELKVPEKVENIDLLSFLYRVDEGVPAVVEGKDGYKNSDNCRFKIYKEKDNLMLCALDKKFCFKLESLKAIEKRKCELHLSYWHKDKKCTDESFKKYGLKIDGGKVTINEYYVLTLDREGEEWGICFPNYEIELLEKVTGIKVK